MTALQRRLQSFSVVAAGGNRQGVFDAIAEHLDNASDNTLMHFDAARLSTDLLTLGKALAAWQESASGPIVSSTA